MTKPISRPLHGFTDYPYVAAVSSAPELLGFEDEPRASCSGGCSAAASSCPASSRAPSGGSCGFCPTGRPSPSTFRALEVLGGVTALAAPWVFGFARGGRARNTFLAMGAFGLMAGLLSEPDEMG